LGPGTRLPPGYESVRELGRGGLGVVVLARHVGLDRLCAVKSIAAPPGPAQEAVARFRREAKALAVLDHPAIVRLYDVVATDSHLLLVMEYADGSDLRRRLDEDFLDSTGALVVLRDVASALAHAAAHGVVHRDVKPANVFVLPDGHAKLGDFGVARVLGDTAAFRTALGTGVGTPTYMAPEQIAGARDVGPPADVYGFSVMAYEVMTGRLPFAATTMDETLDAHLHASPADPSVVLPGFPRDAARVLLAGLAKHPSARPPIGAVAAALDGVPTADWPRPPRARRRRSTAAMPATTIVTGSSSAVRTKAASAEAAPPVTGGAPAPVWIEPVVHRPAPARRSAWWWSLVLIPIALVAGWWVVRGTADRGSIAVRSVSVTIPRSARRASCPGATFSFTGHVVTNGATGPVKVRWTGPDGVAQDPVTARVGSGREHALAVLRFSVRGTRTLRGAATLDVLAPRTSRPTATSARVVYSCR
jgi:serine/threonine-protein kinase